MNEEELIDALKKGAIVMYSDSGADIVALDDLPPAVRECFRASQQHDSVHLDHCPDCLESEAYKILMDAASHREDGNEAVASELEAEAKELKLQANTLRRDR